MVNLENAAGKVISFGDAMEFAKQGISVSNVNWGFRERLSGHPNAMRVEASKIWSAENRKAALRNPDGAITVRPYLTKTDGDHIDNWLPSAKDMYDQWMLSSTFSRLAVIRQKDSPFTNSLDLEFSLIHDSKPTHPFWMLYDQNMIGYGANNICFGASSSSNLRNLLLIEKLEKHINNRQVIGNDIADDVDTITVMSSGERLTRIDVNDDGELTSTNGHVLVSRQVDDRIMTAIANIKTPTNIYLDVDSLNGIHLGIGENTLEYLKGIIHPMSEVNPNINWVSFSFEEQMQLSYDQ